MTRRRKCNCEFFDARCQLPPGHEGMHEEGDTAWTTFADDGDDGPDGYIEPATGPDSKP